jgi:hypothetical protein
METAQLTPLFEIGDCLQDNSLPAQAPEIWKIANVNGGYVVSDVPDSFMIEYDLESSNGKTRKLSEQEIQTLGWSVLTAE